MPVKDEENSHENSLALFRNPHHDRRKRRFSFRFELKLHVRMKEKCEFVRIELDIKYAKDSGGLFEFGRFKFFLRGKCCEDEI